MTSGEQQILNMLMQLNSTVLKVVRLLESMKENGVKVITQESVVP